MHADKCGVHSGLARVECLDLSVLFPHFLFTYVYVLQEKYGFPIGFSQYLVANGRNAGFSLVQRRALADAGLTHSVPTIK